MNKLIDYTDLETFQTNLLNDNATSELATWSSEKISTSKQNRLTAGNNINITADTISADGYAFDYTYGAFATIYNDYWGGSGLVANVATGYGAHAEGARTSASSDFAHAEGYNTAASDNGAHAEGLTTTASGTAAHSEGYGTEAKNDYEHTEGRCNVSHKASNTYGNVGNTQHTIGIGTSTSARKNAIEVMQNGDMYVFGVGGYQGTDTKVQNASILTLQNYIASLEARITALEGNSPVS